MIIRDLITNKTKSKKTPIWFMRQAGRSLPEYLKVRANFSNFIEFCQNPEASAEVTLQPINRFDIDAAIIFSDILIIPYALGNKVEFKKDYGPILEKITNQQDLNKFKNLNTEILAKTAQAISLVKAEMTKNHPQKTLIGFAGAPWTVAAYMVQGAGSKNFQETIAFAYQNPAVFDELIEIITTATIEYLRMQIDAGADVIKIFDSWAGLIPQNLFLKYCIKPIAKIIEVIRITNPKIGIIGFPKGANSNISQYLKMTKVDCIAIDQHVSMQQAIAFAHGQEVVLQGNFDNSLLAFGDFEGIEKQAVNILEATKNTPHIFNLGHGVLPQTPIKNIEKLISTIREYESN